MTLQMLDGYRQCTVQGVGPAHIVGVIVTGAREPKLWWLIVRQIGQTAAVVPNDEVQITDQEWCIERDQLTGP